MVKQSDAKITNSARYKCLEHLRKQSVDLFLCYCGSEICDPGHRYGPIKRTEYLLHVVVSGSGIYKAGGKTYHLGANDAFLIFPGVETTYEASRQDPWSYIWVGFDGLKAKTCLEYAGLNEKHLVTQVQQVEQLSGYIQSMLGASKLTYANELEREAFLSLFLSTLIKEKHEDSGNTVDYPYRVYVEHALEYIEHNYSHNIKIASIAGYIGINRVYLTNSFKKTIGISPQEYLVKFRMDKAAGLLKTTEYSVKDIASRVGYDDPLAFSKMFKLHMGASPSAFRSEMDEPIKATRKHE